MQFTNSFSEALSCGCIGPQNGQPLCPCMMRGVVQRNGRWIRLEQDLGPVLGGFDPEAMGALIAAVARKGAPDAS